jgi:hypothetical protein
MVFGPLHNMHYAKYTALAYFLSAKLRKACSLLRIRFNIFLTPPRRGPMFNLSH